MQCFEIERHLPHLIAGDLPAAARSEVEAHLDACPACAARALPAPRDGDCAAVRTLLPLHVGGDLPADPARAVGRHLAACPACAAQGRAYQGALDGLAQLARETRPDPFWRAMTDRIMAQVAQAAARDSAADPSDTAAPGTLPAARPAALSAAAAAPAPSPAGRLVRIERFLRRAAAAAAVFVLGIGIGYLAMKAGSAVRPEAGTSGPDVAGLPRPRPDSGLGTPPEGGAPSLRPLFPRPTAPVAAAAAARGPRTFGLRDLRAGLVGAPAPAGLDTIDPFHAPDLSFSLEEIHPVDDEELSAGY